MNSPPPRPTPSTRFLGIVALAAGAAILVAIAAGPFFTGLLPVPARTLFWASLIGFNALKWVALYTLAAPRLPERWQPVLPVAGALLLNATLPLEVAFAYRAIGITAAPDPLSVWLIAVLISGLISALVWAATGSSHPPATAGAPQAAAAVAATPASTATDSTGAPPGPPTAPPAAPMAAAPQPPRGLAARVPLANLRAITAEDHYIRLHLATGEKPLILYRFADALADLAGTDGLQVHRGAWVAAKAVAGASREGRRWTLLLTDGTAVPVSEGREAGVRARGWLKPADPPTAPPAGLQP